MVAKKTSLVITSALLLMSSAVAYGQTRPEAPTNADPQANMPCPMYGEGMMRGGRMGMYGGGGGMGMQGGMGMPGMMGGMAFPPGYEKLEMQMHAEMMESMAKIMKKYAAQLPDRR